MSFPRKNRFLFYMLIIVIGVATSCTHSNKLKKQFVNPPKQYKPMPFWHINGELTRVGIRQQMKDAKELAGFSGVSLLPLASDGKKIGTSPRFLSEEYFQRYQDMIDVAQELEMQIILYDDNDFPSGMAGGKMEELYPDHTMKRLDKIEHRVIGPRLFTDSIPGIKLMSAVATHIHTNERVEISDCAVDGVIKWRAPKGEWNVMLFPLVKDSFHKKYLCVDFMDTTAVRHMINQTYNKYYERFGKYFGNTIKMTFFDDVGFWRHPRSWTGRFNEKFIEINGFDPRPYYPALWYDIGAETEAVRNAFFKTRAELLAEGFPKLVGEWAKKHGVKDTGHPPGNYDPTPIDMNGDIFKFYRHTAIPLTDDIIDYGFGKDGHKLVSSAADYYDKPIVSTEVFGAYREADFDSLMLYRSTMDLFARGVNLVVPHGMWYDPNKVYIQPLVSPYSKKIAAALPAYSDYVGRASMLLRGGRRVSEIGVLYPFEELAGWFCFDNPENIRQGFYISPETDYQDVGCWLTNDIRRDFTFIHPELFLDDKYIIKKGRVFLNNKENTQSYRTMILTGCKVISYKTLQKLRKFYDNGGTIIATTHLPYKSSEMGKDQMVVDMVKEIFGINPLKQDGYTELVQSSNFAKGKALFIPNPDAEILANVLEKNEDAPDVRFVGSPKIESELGKLNYIHKVKDGLDIYYFTNSSDEVIDVEVTIKGKLSLESWNPHSCVFSKIENVGYQLEGEQYFTQCNLKIKPVSSVFYISCE
ncbi:glycosyl hydrolase [Saccharicrinis sp. GN24d3]|uniref:glycosyl hydrolase n=1 Tax=Saccharicrinis sp. GN24d3 TaxID=3458416 RepID=UPI00403547E2